MSVDALRQPQSSADLPAAGTRPGGLGPPAAWSQLYHRLASCLRNDKAPLASASPSEMPAYFCRGLAHCLEGVVTRSRSAAPPACSARPPAGRRQSRDRPPSARPLCEREELCDYSGQLSSRRNTLRGPNTSLATASLWTGQARLQTARK